MSQENVKAVRRLLDAYENEGWDAAQGLVAQDFEMTMPPIYPGGGRTYHGPAAARKQMEDWEATFEDFDVEFLEMVDVGNEVVVVLRESGRMRGSETRIEAPFAIVFGLDQRGKIAPMDWFTERAEALEAVGLRE